MKFCKNCRYYDIFRHRCIGDKFAPRVDESFHCQKWKLKKVKVYLRGKRK